MEFQELAKKRYSCRKLSDRKVEPELVQKIIDTAISAPTAVNKQPYKLFLMDSVNAKEYIKKVTKFTFGADTFLVVGSKKEEAWVRKFDDHNFAEVDASIVATHIMMEIFDLGLATTWVGFFNAPELKRRCPQMADYELIALFPVGFAAEDAIPASAHTKRKRPEELSEIL